MTTPPAPCTTSRRVPGTSRRRSGRRAAALPALILVLAASSARAETVRVFAASSLADAFREIAAAFRAEGPGDDVEFNFAGSQVLRLQLEQGAEADVFASADHAHMDSLTRKGEVGPARVFARNRLVVVIPAKHARISGLADLAMPRMRIVVGDAAVPVGRYTARVLGSMTRAGLYGEDYEERVLANVVSREPNARAVLTRVSLGEADAGFVYATDARASSGGVRVIEIPEGVNAIAEYPIAVLSASPRAEAAARFMALVLGDGGQAILRAHGFLPARPASGAGR